MIEILADAHRASMITKNTYNDVDEYKGRKPVEISENTSEIGSPIDIQVRKDNLVKNIYKDEASGYNSNNPNALSTGDEKGKGEYNGQIGSSTDIKARKENLVKNTYKNDDTGYNSSHPNALSTGDEKGKGELSNNIGSKTDISKRSESLAKNKFKQTYGYPDF